MLHKMIGGRLLGAVDHLDLQAFSIYNLLTSELQMF